MGKCRECVVRKNEINRYIDVEWQPYSGPKFPAGSRYPVCQGAYNWATFAGGELVDVPVTVYLLNDGSYALDRKSLDAIVDKVMM
jgi:hypothetical protein